MLNRSRHRAYPKRVCEVVYQRNSRTCQFTFTCDGSIGRRAVNAVAWARAERIAREVYEGRSASQLPKNSVNYHANYVRPSWGQRLARVRQIGAHIFYGAPLNGGSTPGAYERTPEAVVQQPLFMRNETLDRAYALMAAQAASPDATGATGS
ncbi:Cell Wall Hydrolase [compost metagenome]